MTPPEQTKIKKTKSISYRLPIMRIASCFIIILIFSVMLYAKFQSRMLTEYEKIAQGATNLMALELDGDMVDEYIEKNYTMQEYNRILKRFYEIRKSFPDILYLYVYRLTPEGGIVVFDLNSPDGTQDAGYPGDFYEFEDIFMSHMDEFLSGEYVPAISGPTEDGYLVTFCQPVFDSSGKLQCHCCVDFSVDDLRREDFEFMLSVITVSSIVALIIMFLSILWMRRRITQPLDMMTKAAEQFTYQTREDHEENIRRFEALNIRSKDEIGALYRLFVSVIRQSNDYMESLDRAESDIRSKDAQIGQMSLRVFKDALTSVGNQAAYASLAAELDESIRTGEAEFAVVMLDANNLKKINDTYGHEKGDSYIQGCCHIICETYRKSPVFRVGGDEFVVVLRGHDYEMRDELFTEITDIFAELNEQQEKEPWERYSMSLGMAQYFTKDENVKQILKRADAAMYLNKTAYKRKYGSYR